MVRAKRGMVGMYQNWAQLRDFRKTMKEAKPRYSKILWPLDGLRTLRMAKARHRMRIP